MSTQAKQALILATLKHGLTLANQGSVFWTRKDAMQSVNLYHSTMFKMSL